MGSSSPTPALMLEERLDSKGDADPGGHGSTVDSHHVTGATEVSTHRYRDQGVVCTCGGRGLGREKWGGSTTGSNTGA